MFIQIIVTFETEAFIYLDKTFTLDSLWFAIHKLSENHLCDPN